MEINNETNYLLKLNENGGIWSMKGKLEFADKWFLMESPFPLTVITICYLMFVLKLGPAYMKTRQPYDLRTFLIFYNVGQVILSILLFFLGLSLVIRNGLVPRKCLVSDETTKMIANGIHYYFICKLVELLDTIFFVLRKKQNQVTFLHVYHHTMMVCSSWLTLKLEPTYTTMFLGTLNTFVHIVMYTYYALSAFPNMSKYLWWKRYITKMQLIQFFLVFLQAIATYVISECKPSYLLGALIIFNAILFSALFGDFYFKAYSSSRAKGSTNGISKEINDKSNGVEIIKNGNGVKYRNGANKIN